MTAGGAAILIGLLPIFGVVIASLPVPVLAAASTLLFGIIAISGVQMMQTVVWDELNLAVAGTSFIVSLGLRGRCRQRYLQAMIRSFKAFAHSLFLLESYFSSCYR